MDRSQSLSEVLDSVHHPDAPAVRFSAYIFLALVALEVGLIWIFPYFPSEDGPSHLHNASVLADYGKETIYREYYQIIPFRPAGNMLTQFMLVGLLKLSGPRFAEKVLLTGYAILLPFSFRYLLKAFTPKAEFSFFAFVLLPNYFLYLGLWNFCFSICFAFLTLGFFFRHTARWTPRSILVLAIGGLGVYLTHVVSWGVCMIAIVSWSSVQLISEVWGLRGPSLGESFQKRLRHYGLPLCALMPPAILLIMHLAGSKEVSACSQSSWRARLHPLYSLAFLQGITDLDLTMARVVVVTLVLLFAFSGVFVFRQKSNRHGIGMLFASVASALFAVVGPDCIGTGLFIHRRVALYACAFLVLWLATQSWPPAVLRATSVVFCAIAMSSLIARYPVHRKWSQQLSEFVSVGQRIRPQKTVLLVQLKPYPQGSGKIWPYEHAVGLLSDRDIIDLGNYEAFTDYFSTSFWPNRSPVPALGTAEQLDTVPPVFDIGRYEGQTQGRVDYILALGNTDLESSGREPEMGEIRLYGSQMTKFQMVSSGQGGNLRLYERTSQ